MNVKPYENAPMDENAGRLLRNSAGVTPQMTLLTNRRGFSIEKHNNIDIIR